jgi:predicted outer membrane protein
MRSPLPIISCGLAMIAVGCSQPQAAAPAITEPAAARPARPARVTLRIKGDTRPRLRHGGELVAPDTEPAPPAAPKQEVAIDESLRQPEVPRVEAGVGPIAVQHGLDDDMIVRIAHAINQSEIARARHAMQRGQSEAVRGLASRTLRKHLAIERQLNRLARSANLQPADSEVADEVARRTEARLADFRQQTESTFDRVFLESQIDEQQKIALLVDVRLMPATTDESVRAVLQRLAPTVKRNLAQAQSLRSMIKEKE